MPFKGIKITALIILDYIFLNLWKEMSHILADLFLIEMLQTMIA